MCKILLIEDDHKLRPHLVNILDEAGYSVIPGGTIAESEKLIKEHSIDMAVIDLVLPNGDGMEIVKSIYEKIPTILMAKNSTAELRNEAAVYGVAGFLEKPFNEEIFITIVDRVMENKMGRKTIIETSNLSSSRKVGESVDLERIYAKIATISSRVNRTLGMEDEIEKLREDFQEQCGCVRDLIHSVDLLKDRTRQCEERGKAIALIEQRMDYQEADIQETRSQIEKAKDFLNENGGTVATIINSGGVLLFLIGKSQGWW